MASIDGPLCARRLKALLDHWQANSELWGSATSLAVPRGPASKDDDDIRYQKSLALHYRLFEYEVPETVMLLTRTELHIVLSPKKAEVMRPIIEPARELAGIAVTLHTYERKTEDGRAQLERLVAVARAAGGPLGVLKVKEAPEGPLCQLWDAVLAAAALPTADVNAAMAECAAVKDAEELTCVRKATHLVTTVVDKFLLPKLEDVIDGEKSISHFKLAQSAEEVALEPGKPPVAVKLRVEHIEVAYPFIVQSAGSTYNLKWTAGSDNEKLRYDPQGVIVCQLGVKYKQYCGNVARTYLIDPPKSIQDNYAALYAAHQAAIAALVEGAPLSAAYEAAAAELRKAPGDLAAHLGKNVGTVTGIEFTERTLALAPGNGYALRAGVTVNVCCGLSGLTCAEAEDERDRAYALVLADTVLVTAGGAAPDVLTKCKAKPAEVLYEIKDGGEDEEEEEAAPTPGSAKKSKGPSVVREGKTRGEEGNKSKDDKLRKQQDELGRLKNEETLRRLTEQSARAANKASTSAAVTDFKAYKAVTEVPDETARTLMMHVDVRSEALLLPIHGALVPFHIGTVKNATVSQGENNSMIVRINFNTPGPGVAAATAWPPAAAHPDCTFVREISYRCADARHANEIVNKVKNLRASVRQRDAEAAERATLVRQEPLQLAKTKLPALNNLWVRPNFGGRGRKLPGVLETHANGFRYHTSKQGEVLDIIFSNIKHAFFQPSKKELVTLVHFHLHDPIMVGKKKTKDVQFFTEVMEAVQATEGGRRGYDADELEDEQRERERRNRINSDYQRFVKSVQDFWERAHPDKELEFDIPYPELGFPGVPFKSSSMVFPTVNCMVDLIETPFLVVTLSEIEIVNLERVGFGLKNFDMAIVYKDFAREVHRIDAIDTKYLDTVKEWLTSVGIKYYESKMNLNWKPILKTILDDPTAFIEDGGWEFLNLEASDSEEEGSDASEGYQPTEDESEEESSSDDDDSDAADSDEEDGSDEEEEDEEEEEGLDWDELEEQARKEDAAASDGDSEEERRRKRKGGAGGKGGGSSKAPPPPAKKPKK